MGSKWEIKRLSGDNLELWKVKVKAIIMAGMMDKTWNVVIRCLGDKELMEIAMKISLERR
ncbi:hypothetical protein A2U01_0084402, partial [Trifolium medium]|nr:hypothetical protein [Trifolium medium]